MKWIVNSDLSRQQLFMLVLIDNTFSFSWRADWNCLVVDVPLGELEKEFKALCKCHNMPHSTHP